MQYFILSLVCIILSGCGQITQEVSDSGIAEFRIQDLTLQQVINQKIPPEVVGAWVYGHVAYVDDIRPEDEYKTPERTLLEGGDCEDFARLFEYIFDSQGIKACILIFETQSGSCHALCYTAKGITSNGNYFKIELPKERAYEIYTLKAELIQEYNFY